MPNNPEIKQFVERIIAMTKQAERLTFPDMLTKLNVMTLVGILLDHLYDANIKKD